GAGGATWAAAPQPLRLIAVKPAKARDRRLIWGSLAIRRAPRRLRARTARAAWSRWQRCGGCRGQPVALGARGLFGERARCAGRVLFQVALGVCPVLGQYVHCYVRPPRLGLDSPNLETAGETPLRLG